jgi:hypothetical protein
MSDAMIDACEALDHADQVLDTVELIFDQAATQVGEGLLRAHFAGKAISEEQLRALHPELRAAVHFELTDEGRRMAERLIDEL